MNLYNILNINNDASKKDIKQAYLKLAKIYHPDKNKNFDAHEKFIEIHTAYEILYNNDTNKNYHKMLESEKNFFNEFIKNFIKILDHNGSFDLIEKYLNKLNKTDFLYIKENLLNFIREINIIELFEIFCNGKFKKKIFLTYSDSESETNMEYYYILPLYLQKNNENDIRIDLVVELIDVIENNKKKIKIKRNINNEIIISTFIFNISHPYIVFYQGGDISNKIIGNLIIKIILPNNIYWDNDILFIDYPMNLYELIYGININSITEIENWIPYKNGFSIDISKNINIIIKLYLDYDDTNENRNLLKKYFNNNKNLVSLI